MYARSFLHLAMVLSSLVLPAARAGAQSTPAAPATAATSTEAAASTNPVPTTDSVAAHNAHMAWWRDARFGMFIHWGVYSVPAGRYKDKEVPGLGEWIMHDARIPRATYQAYAGQFDPVNYDPDAWVRLAREAGVKYIVITAKHHDGFALFESKASSWNVVQATPYGKDLLAPLAAACRKYGMRLGFYYSQANDWNNPGGAAAGGHWDSTQNGDMDDYIRNVAVPQVREILTHYGDVAELWWDVPSDMTPERAAQFLPLLSLQPNIIVNNRLGGGVRGDIETPEQYIPATGIPGRDWETCMTMNDTWGYKTDDHHWKSAETLIRNLVDIASKGGNYLLNVGPTSLGEFPKPIVERLQAIGRWMKVNGEAIYGTQASPIDGVDWGRCTARKEPGGGTTIYVHVFDWPKDGRLLVPELHNGPASAYLLDGGKRLKTQLDSDGLVVYLPKTAPDTIASVIVLKNINPLIVAVPIPKPIAANPDGSVTLDAPHAGLHAGASGEAPQVEGDPRNIGFWTEEDSWVDWLFTVSKPGTYSVQALVATPADTVSWTFRLEHTALAGSTKPQVFAHYVHGTGGYGAYQTQHMADILIREAGTYILSIRPDAGRWKPVNLRSISLKPEKVVYAHAVMQ